MDISRNALALIIGRMTHAVLMIATAMLLSRLGRAARQTVADRYSREAYAEQYDTIYQEIIGR